MSSLLPLRVTIPLPWHFVSFRAVLDLLTAIRIVTTLGPSRLVLPDTMASADSRLLRFYIALGFRLANRASRGKTQFFRRTTSGFTASVLRLPLGLRFVLQPYPPFSLISGFCS